jgi:hypothetical protein
MAKQEVKQEENSFSKEALLQSQRYADNRDLLAVLLEDAKSYSLTEVDSLIEKFQKGKVK